MIDLIVDHAIRNVWCSPGQDLQSVIKPARLSPNVGVWNYFQTTRRAYNLPTSNDRYHVYAIGQLFPLILGLTPVEMKWVRFSDACIRENLFAELYNADGLNFPLAECYYLVTEDRNLILAVKEQDRNPIKLRDEDLFVRVYTNAFFRSERCNPDVNFIDVFGGRVLSNANILAIQNKYNNYQTLPGRTLVHVNGYLVSGVNMLTVKLGDYVEVIYDGSIYHTVELPIADLQSFVSTMDKKAKYLLHYPGKTNNIDYQDDLTIYLTKADESGRWTGVYYHRNKNRDAIRMVTHKDYSIVQPYVQALLTAQDGWNSDNCKVRIYIRHSGYDRPLVTEANRIHELYKMQDADVVKAFVGVEANVPGWRADTLEGSAYTEVMRSESENVTRLMVQNAYGYNSITKLTSDTPSLFYDDDNMKIVQVPFGLRNSCTAYEYDAAGLYLGFYQHYSGTEYASRNPNAAKVELIAGPGGTRLDEVYGKIDVGLDEFTDYRFYTCPIESGLPSNKWTDVTGTDKVAATRTQVHFNVDPTRYYTLVRGNRSFLAYELELMMEEGLLQFSLTSLQNREGTDRTWVMQIPLGETEIILNGHSLIEGVDYNGVFPRYVITSKKWLVNPETEKQKIAIRSTGHCLPNLTQEPVQDKGFVVHGLLSDNNRFDVRDDKVQRMVVGGGLYHRSELKFAESDSGVTVPDAANGLPYSIRDLVPPVRGAVDGDTYSLRAAAQIIDKQISDYLTIKIPEPVIPGPNVIVERYPVFSPFFAKIMFDLVKGDLVDDRIKTSYSDSDVYAICKPYEWLLKFDPTQTDTAVNSDYVVIHPHPLNDPVGVDVFMYRFLTRVTKIYLKDKLILSGYLTISS